jgi:drug/metabolite transporter (DMT)-like permease
MKRKDFSSAYDSSFTEANHGNGDRGIASQQKVVAMAVTFCILWSSAFVATKIGLSSSPPLLLASFRFLIAGPLMILMALAIQPKDIPTSRAFALLAVLGILNNTIYLGLTFIALESVSASLVSIIASINPLITVVLAHFFLKEKMTARKAIGLVAGLAGVAFIMRHRVGMQIDAPIGIGLAFAGVTSFVFGTMLFKKAMLENSLLMINGVQVLVGGMALLPIALLSENVGAIRLDHNLIFALTYLVVCVSMGGALLWFWLLRESTASAASSWHFLNPALGIFFGVVVLGEKTVWSDYLGLVPIVIGILLVTRSSRNTSRFVDVNNK